MRAIVRIALVACLVAAAAPAAAQSSPDPTGHWEGAVTAPFGTIDFEIDVTRSESGALVATYGQPAQGVRGLPLSKVALEGRTFTFVVAGGGPPSVFTAELQPDGKTMSGAAAAAQGSAPFTITRTGEARVEAPIRNAAVTGGLEGTWNGVLDVGGRQARLVLAIANQTDGTARAVLTQPDKATIELPVALSQSGTTVKADVRIAMAVFSGTLNAAGTELSGTWSQQGASLPLTFTKAAR